MRAPARGFQDVHVIIVHDAEGPGDGPADGGGDEESGGKDEEGAEAAVARINLDNAPSPEILARLRAENSDIIELNLLEMK